MMSFLHRLMAGRYGNDTLNRALFVVSLLLLGMEWLTRWRWLSPLILALLVLCYVRMFSRNIRVRYAENQKFLTWYQPFRQELHHARVRFADRKTHRYFRCPKCGLRLRVPKGRGRINISCPNCSTQFIRKS